MIILFWNLVYFLIYCKARWRPRYIMINFYSSNLNLDALICHSNFINISCIIYSITSPLTDFFISYHFICNKIIILSFQDSKQSKIPIYRTIQAIQFTKKIIPTYKTTNSRRFWSLLCRIRGLLRDQFVSIYRSECGQTNIRSARFSQTPTRYFGENRCSN